MGVIKKTVVLDDRIERFVRRTQALMLEAEPPIEATYSSALNFMLLAAIHEASRPGGLSAETREVIWDFARDNDTLEELNLHERMGAVRAALLLGEGVEHPHARQPPANPSPEAPDGESDTSAPHPTAAE